MLHIADKAMAWDHSGPDNCVDTLCGNWVHWEHVTENQEADGNKVCSECMLIAKCNVPVEDTPNL